MTDSVNCVAFFDPVSFDMLVPSAVLFTTKDTRDTKEHKEEILLFLGLPFVSLVSLVVDRRRYLCSVLFLCGGLLHRRGRRRGLLRDRGRVARRRDVMVRGGR